LGTFVGQETLKERLRIAVDAARERGEFLEHVLFHGPPGLGKTTLAHIIAAEMNGKLVTTSGPALEKTADLMGILTNLELGDVLFVDEIHRTPRAIEEYLYPAMEDFAVDFVLDKGPFAKAIRLALKRFTLVGATTRAGLISSPLRDRFGLYFHLDFYSPEALAAIVARSADILGVPIAPDATGEIARRARGTPRIANRLLGGCATLHKCVASPRSTWHSCAPRCAWKGSTTPASTSWTVRFWTRSFGATTADRSALKRSRRRSKRRSTRSAT